MRLLYFDTQLLEPDVSLLKQMHSLRLMVSNLPDCLSHQEAQRRQIVPTL